MININISYQRLCNQGIVESRFKSAREVVKGLGAVQAQDYFGAKWAIGLRLPGSTEKDVEKAVSKGEIIRTHILRPTWHFVAPEDIRWMLALTAPRVKAMINSYSFKIKLNEKTFLKSNKILESALKGKRQLVRDELRKELERAGINTKGLRFIFILMRAELDALICSGAKRGKQFTYALLQERVPKAKHMTPGEALAKLVERYFTSHGPATAYDFCWWSGLKISDAKKGLEMIKSKIKRKEISGKTYWFSRENEEIKSPGLHLLPNYDEYFSYKDRSMYLSKNANFNPSQRSSLSRHIIILDGKIIGGWKTNLGHDKVVLSTKFFTKLNKKENQMLLEQINRFSEFNDVKVEIIQ